MMKRRQLLRYGGASLLTALALSQTAERSAAQAPGALTVRYFGHSCFLFSGEGARVLTNPFDTLGCTAGYRSPEPEADVVLISSQLLDEGFVNRLPGNPGLLYEPGRFEARGLQFEGIRTPHDRIGGKRFGFNVMWKWQQGGINILHLGGAASPIDLEASILIGRPDLAIVPVGGGPKNYDAIEARAAIARLQPKIVIPSMYRTDAADPAACDLEALDAFLAEMSDFPTQVLDGDSWTVRPGDLPAEGTAIRVLRYPF